MCPAVLQIWVPSSSPQPIFVLVECSGTICAGMLMYCMHVCRYTPEVGDVIVGRVTEVRVQHI
jgi:hypothetical protein